MSGGAQTTGAGARMPSMDEARAPLLALVSPRRQAWPLLGALLVGALVGAAAVGLLGAPAWAAAAGALATLLPPAARKWADDRRRYGPGAMLLSVLLALQALHTLEQLVRWSQFHVLRWPALASTGLIPPAGAEWAQAAWSWALLLLCAALVAGGMRGWWAWALLAWACAHTFEHTFVLWRALQTAQELADLGVRGLPARSLPGFFGRDGWLASADAAPGAFLRRLPGLTSAPQLDIHFWQSAGQLALLLPAAGAYMERLVRRRPARGA